MKYILLISILFLYFCKSSINADITISPSINISDSILVLNIRNNTDRNFVIEFPELENFVYKDQLEKSTPEIIYKTKSFVILDDEEDIVLNKKIECISFKKELAGTNNTFFKFLNKRSQKVYFLKIKNYRKGKTIILEDDGFDVISNIANTKNENIVLPKIKNQKCGKYEYFTGSFEFTKKEITLP